MGDSLLSQAVSYRIKRSGLSCTKGGLDQIQGKVNSLKELEQDAQGSG